MRAVRMKNFLILFLVFSSIPIPSAFLYPQCCSSVSEYRAAAAVGGIVLMAWTGVIVYAASQNDCSRRRCYKDRVSDCSSGSSNFRTAPGHVVEFHFFNSTNNDVSCCIICPDGSNRTIAVPNNGLACPVSFGPCPPVGTFNIIFDLPHQTSVGPTSCLECRVFHNDNAFNAFPVAPGLYCTPSGINTRLSFDCDFNPDF